MASVAIRLSKKYHGRGYGTEALSAMVGFCFEKTELKRLWAEVLMYSNRTTDFRHGIFSMPFKMSKSR